MFGRAYSVVCGGTSTVSHDSSSPPRLLSTVAAPNHRDGSTHLRAVRPHQLQGEDFQPVWLFVEALVDFTGFSVPEVLHGVFKV